jgi:predicted dinucleotide-binding enzyme
VTTIGFIGAGKIGSQLARKAIENGYEVVLSNSRGPETLADLVLVLGPHARAATAQDAAEAGDLAVVTMPFGHYREVPVEPLAGKVVIDTNNYYFERDGHFAELDDHTATSSGLLQQHLPTSRVVKAFNHIGWRDITDDSHPAGDPRRRALAISGDDPDARATVAALHEQFGFDTIDIGPLSESWRIERDQPAYVVPQNLAELEANLARATR